VTSKPNAGQPTYALYLSEGECEEQTMNKTIHGKVHGKTIELAEELGVPEGQEVEITVRTVSSIKATRTGEGLLLTEGALADDPYWGRHHGGSSSRAKDLDRWLLFIT
jgi:hypothetical protein